MMRRQNKTDPTESEQPRRNFLLKIWLGLGAIALAEVVWLVISFLRPRKPLAKKGGFGTIIETGTVDSFATETVTAFPRGHFYLTRLEDGGFLALSRTCTHLGCTVPWVPKDKKFICPCHASTFDMTGDVLNSPAPRALDRHQVYIENNIVKVDTSVRMKRTEFRKEQVTYPRKP